jgi:SAM-dependent methyltransferase
VDLSESLLRELSTQVERLPAHRAADRLTTVHGDMLTLSLGTRFAAALLGITTIGLVPPRKRPDFLRTIHSHLLPGGRFLVSVNVPPHGPGEEDITTTVVRDAVLTVISRIEPNGAGRHVSMLRIGRGTTPLLATSFVHLVTPEQLSDELVAAGFEMESVRPVANSLNRPADGCALLVARRPS